ncbi:MAG TPA: DUF4340 domain-containing protein, partial [Candidatus Methylacidiphilales bacterium]
MKPFRSTFLFLLAAAVLLVVLWATKNVQGTAEAEKAKGRLFDFSSDDVTSLKIKTGDGAVSLEKKDNVWRIVEPVKAEAEREAVLSLLGELEFLQPRRTIAASEIPDGEKSLAEWGLSPAAARIEFSGKTSAGKPFSEVLLVGRTAAVPGLSYAKKEGDKGGDAYLIAASSRDAFFKKLDDLRTRSVIHADAATIDQVGLRQKGGTTPDAPSEFQISRGKDPASDWHVDKPLSAPA